MEIGKHDVCPDPDGHCMFGDDESCPVLGTHTHKCMRCGEEFFCFTPDVCKAKEEVLPRIAVPGPRGSVLFFEHVCGPLKAQCELTKQQIDDMRVSLGKGTQPFTKDAIDNLCALAAKAL